MRNLFRKLIVLSLVLSLLLGATSCDVLTGMVFGGNDNPPVNGGSGDNSIDTSHDHSHTASGRVSPTCTEKGSITYSCECGNSFTVELAVSAHSYKNGICTVCGDDNGTGGGNTEQKPDGGNTDIPDDGTVVYDSGIIYLPNEDDPITSDPYVNVDETEFYANYTPAISYMDAYYRSAHGLMSGSIEVQNATPTFSSYQPTKDGMLVRNTTYIYSKDGRTYYVVDAYGNIVNEIYKCGAYVTLEEVAAYLFAFGTYPANHSANKKTKPTESIWGKYLRVNYNDFSGNVIDYPNEPALPNSNGVGGKLQYKELDIGTSGYNNGTGITRGACRIVFAKYDADGDGIIEVNETYLFYTQNHYQDFREYLNYEGGWGEIFGNATGGGIGKPTQYVKTAYASFVNEDGTPMVQTAVVMMVWVPRREEV